MRYDVAIVGAGIAGLATAARLQAAGLSTIVFEAHRQPGGCAGYFSRRGFAFDVGATTLVDFERGGIGAELLQTLDLPSVDGEALPGYVAWLPDRRVTLYRDRQLWHDERLRQLGDTTNHRRFWKLMDQLSDVFWQASRRGIQLPIKNAGELWRAIGCIGPSNLLHARYAGWTMGDALRRYQLDQDKPLVGLLSMLIEDTVHSTVDAAPLINSALGITIRGAGLTRARGGMRGFWRGFVRRYRSLGGQLLLNCRVNRVRGDFGEFNLETSRGTWGARQVVSALPAPLTAKLAPPVVQQALRPYLERDKGSYGGAIVVFLGVPEQEVASQTWTHHQLLQSYSDKLGNGNNMFISVSAPDDVLSAPKGHRAVMISTHCELTDWQGLERAEYQQRKLQIGNRLIALARRVYPDLGNSPLVYEVGTPRTYEQFTLRPQGAVGGVRQNLQNSNQAAIPYAVGQCGFWNVGDSTWPGLGTVACVLGSRLAAEQIREVARGNHDRRRPTPSRSQRSQRQADERTRVA